MWYSSGVLLLLAVLSKAKLDGTEEDSGESGDNRDLEDSGERIGASVTQVYRHPYSAALLNNNTFVCSAVILNPYWLVTLSKCFDTDVISSYVTHKNLGNYTVRVGSSYHNKNGAIHKVKLLFNNFDLKVSAVKVQIPFLFSSKISSVTLPKPDEEVSLGYLSSIIAWTPNGHIRTVNVPLIDPSICETFTKLLPGHYICTGGVQDPDRNFCRKDNGGAVIQNDTLIAISSFLHTCAIYTKTHAFPRVSAFSRWLDSVIWDEHNRPTSIITTSAPPEQTTSLPEHRINSTEAAVENRSPYFSDPRNFMLTLPFDPINVPLEPAEDNSVIPRMSLYESYLRNLAKAKTSTTEDPSALEEQKLAWLQKYGKSVINYGKKFDQYDYNK